MGGRFNIRFDIFNIRFSNLTVATLTATVLALLVCLFQFPIPPPQIWEDVAAGAGLRPPVSVLGGFIRGIYALLFAVIPSSAVALFLIKALGWVSAAVITLLAYQIFEYTMPYSPQLAENTKGVILRRSCLAGACILFICNDAVWLSVQALSATGLKLMILLASILATFRFIGSRQQLFAALAMAGYTLLIGETPLGFVGILWIILAALRIQHGGNEASLKNILAVIFLRRILVLETFGLIILVLTIEYHLFTAQGGVFPGELGLTDFLSAYFGGIKDMIVNAASWKRWILAFLTAIAPFFVTINFCRRDFNGERFIPAYRLATYIGIGLLSWSQSSGLVCISFRHWLFDRAETSPLLLAVLALISVTTFLWMMTQLGNRVFFDTAVNIVDFHYDDAHKTEIGRRIVNLMAHCERYERPAYLVLSGVILLIALLARTEFTARGMLRLVGDYLDETVRECQGLERVVTDGALDAGIEIAAFRKGRTLITLSMTAGQKAREVKLRQRGITTPDDLESLKTPFPNTLRSWVNNQSAYLQTLGTQLALDSWRNVPRKNRPVVYGTIAKLEKNFDELIRTQDWGRDFANRIIELYDRHPPTATTDHHIHECFLFVQFRTARFCQWRAEASGRIKWGENSRIEQDLADRLDQLNPSYQNAKRMLTQMNSARNVTLTPRENLRICLQNADFDAATPFAELIYEANADDAEANWALGMHHFLQRNYIHAEPYLTRCLKMRPEDPAVLNNLAIAEREIGRLDAAEQHIREGLGVLPDSPHLQRTLNSILKAKSPR